MPSVCDYLGLATRINLVDPDDLFEYLWINGLTVERFDEIFGIQPAVILDDKIYLHDHDVERTIRQMLMELQDG